VSPAETPAGFVQFEAGCGRLLVDDGVAAEVRSAGLTDPSGWERLLEESGTVVARGAIARHALPSGARRVLKQLRRGGWVGPLWRDRFLGARRLLDNLRLPLEALSRGVATPRPVALLIVEGPLRFFRGWLAVEEITDARDLASRFVSASPPSRAGLVRVMSLVRRMHEVGLEHRDLNLGNLLLSDGAGRDGAAYVIDLDGARLHDRPLPFARCQQALRRLERSFVKLLGPTVQDDEARGWIYECYAGTDTELAGRLERGRAVGRLWLRIHRLGWR
jgi:3-deoxy-D-manno-octulosonic acid kinase